MSSTALIADIGGTTSRIARAGIDGIPYDARVESNDSYAGIDDLVENYLKSVPGATPILAVFGVAGPVDGEHVRLTNRNWVISAPAIAARLKVKEVRLVNDFVALAHGVPRFSREDLVEVGAGHPLPGAPMLVCGPGTGLGTALVLPRGESYEVLPSEAGHTRFGAVNTDEARVLAHMVRDFGAVSVERVLSGSGLVRLHRILTGEEIPSQTLIRAAVAGQAREKETCHLFLRMLGRVIGDLCLAFEARGGVFIPGGVARAMSSLFADSPFRAAFEDHPPYGDRLANVPVHVVVNAAPGLVGAGEIARRRLAAQD